MAYAYEQPNGQVAICSLSSSVPTGARWHKVESLPEDTFFRDAWELKEGGVVTVDLAQAKIIAHELRRNHRDKLMAPWDKRVAEKIPGKCPVVAEAERVHIRIDNGQTQREIDFAQSVEDLAQVVKFSGVAA